MRHLKVGAGLWVATMYYTSSALGAEIKTSGNVEFNFDPILTTEDKTPSSKTTVTESKHEFGGRGWLSFSSRKDLGSYYALGRTAVTLDTAGNAAADEAIAQFGTKSWNLTLGSFGGQGAFNGGPDIILVDAPNGPGSYAGDAAVGRGFAFNFMASGLTAQLYLAPKMDTIATGSDSESMHKWIGIRPAIKYSAGPVSVAFAFETVSKEAVSKTEVDGTETVPGDNAYSMDMTGYAINVGANVGPVTAGVSIASKEDEEKNYLSVTDATTDPVTTARMDMTTKVTTTAVFASMDLGGSNLAVGARMTSQEVESGASTGSTKTIVESSHNQYYVSYDLPLPVEGSAIKFGFSTATAEQGKDDAKVEGSATGFRIRYFYSF